MFHQTAFPVEKSRRLSELEILASDGVRLSDAENVELRELLNAEDAAFLADCKEAAA